MKRKTIRIQIALLVNINYDKCFKNPNTSMKNRVVHVYITNNKFLSSPLLINNNWLNSSVFSFQDVERQTNVRIAKPN